MISTLFESDSYSRDDTYYSNLCTKLSVELGEATKDNLVNFHTIGNHMLMLKIVKESGESDDDTISIVFNICTNIDIKDMNGNSLLHKAVYLEKYDIVKLLVDNGCYINIRNKLDQTPYDLNMDKYPTVNNMQIRRYLVNSGAIIPYLDRYCIIL